jgi:hypothetical protein
MSGYEEIAGLDNVYLEESWVLGVYESDDDLTFDLEVVLTDGHPQWEPPKPGEMYCYRRTALTFSNVRGIEWLERGTRPATDATGSEDWGHIDTFVADGGRYELTGDWGRVRFSSERPQLRDR